MTLVGLAARNVLRNKFRSALTIVGVAVTVLTFVLLRTVLLAWTSGADYAAKDRIVTRHKITFVMTLPLRYVETVRRAPGVKSATFANWFGGKDPRNDREFFATIAVDQNSYFEVYDEMSIAPDVKERWMADRTAAIVGDVLAKKLGWKVGDTVTLESGIYPNPPDKPWTFTVAGMYTATAKSVDRSTFIMHWDYVNDALAEQRRNEIGWIVSRVNDPRRAADTSVALDKVFDAEDIQTLSQDERAFQTSFLASVSAVLKALEIVSAVILVIMMLILGNTIAMGVRERTNEYGVLRALGFLPRHIAGFILGEALVIAAAGGALGVALSYPIVERGMGRWIEENLGSIIPYFRISGAMAAVAFTLAVLLGTVASAIPAYRASKLRVTDALRRVA